MILAKRHTPFEGSTANCTFLRLSAFAAALAQVITWAGCSPSQQMHVGSPALDDKAPGRTQQSNVQRSGLGPYDGPGAIYLNGNIRVGDEPQLAEYVMVFDDRDLPTERYFDRFAFETFVLRNALADDGQLDLIERLPRRIAAPPGYLSVAAVMIEETRHGDASLRNRAIRALGLLGDRRAIPALLEALQDKKWDLADRVVYAQWPEIGRPEIEGPLPETFGGRTYNASEAVQSLAALNAVEAIAPLQKLLLDQSCPFRPTVADALGQLGSEDVIGSLEQVGHEADSSSDTNLSYWCGRAVLHVRARMAGEKTLVRQLSESDPATVYYAVQELGTRGGPATLPALEALYDNSRIVETSAGMPYIVSTIGTFAKWSVAAIRECQEDELARQTPPPSATPKD